MMSWQQHCANIEAYALHQTCCFDSSHDTCQRAEFMNHLTELPRIRRTHSIENLPESSLPQPPRESRQKNNNTAHALHDVKGILNLWRCRESIAVSAVTKPLLGYLWIRWSMNCCFCFIFSKHCRRNFSINCLLILLFWHVIIRYLLLWLSRRL